MFWRYSSSVAKLLVFGGQVGVQRLLLSLHMNSESKCSFSDATPLVDVGL